MLHAIESQLAAASQDFHSNHLDPKQACSRNLRQIPKFSAIRLGHGARVLAFRTKLSARHFSRQVLFVGFTRGSEEPPWPPLTKAERPPLFLGCPATLEGG